MGMPAEELEIQDNGEEGSSELEKSDSDAVTVVLEAEPKQNSLEEVSSDAETVVIGDDDEEIQLEKKGLIEEQQLTSMRKQKSRAARQELEQQQQTKGQGEKSKKRKSNLSSDEDDREKHGRKKPKKPKIKEDEGNELDEGYASLPMVFSQQVFQVSVLGSQAGADVQDPPGKAIKRASQRKQ